MGLREDALNLHQENRGKLAVVSKVKLENAQDLSLAYSPGVAEPCKEIAQNSELSFEYTNRGNLVALLSDGTAVLGLGDIGPTAAMPVMEGKAILYKHFADVDAFPLCIATQAVEEIIQAVRWLEPTFGGIHLEDISGPRCFMIEEKLNELLDIPVFHDDQHGTAVVCLAGILNALKVVDKRLDQIKVVINGAGAAGISVAKLLIAAGIGAERIKLCDIEGVLYPGRKSNNDYHEAIARMTNPAGAQETLAQILPGADVFIGVSAPRVVTAEMVRSMAPRAIVFALANPTPEIMPEEALAGGAAIVGTGRSDYPNQVNNLLGFPGIFRGALDVRASAVNETMKIAAAEAIAALIPAAELTPDYVIPGPFDRRVVPAVALAVAQAAIDSGVARQPRTKSELRDGLAKRGLV